MKEAASEDQVSVSTWMTQAARAALTVRDGLSAVAEWETEHGPLTETELSEARQRVAAQLGWSTPATT